MISLAEARALVLGACPPLPPRIESAASSLGCVVARPVVSRVPVPPFANTAMDGYALRAADTIDAPVDLRVVATLPAGSSREPVVGRGEAVRIMTGAPMPPGADAIVVVEAVSASRDGRRVTIHEPADPGAFVRLAGTDIAVDSTVIDAGAVLRPGHLGLLASIGCAEVAVHPRPRVGVLSTGDELVDGGFAGPLSRGQIRDANRPSLLALLGEAGCEPIDLGIVADDEAATEAALRCGVETCDALLVSGGVSMGDHDYVKVVLQRMGTGRWMQVAIRPAKPLAFGTIDVDREDGPRAVPVFGLPGNPVSSMVSFELFARPALRSMMGWPVTALDRPTVRAVAAEGLVRGPDGRTMYARVHVAYREGSFVVRSAGGQASHQLHAMAEANGLAVVPDGNGIPPGGEVEVLLTGDFRVGARPDPSR